ncbi:hypothetical protein CEXT_166441 [Caerostris extrusa]|uniref:Uncharacterized protein n=1 Tax=Caerostris extrusa TaxID=172846 RepID=A0AAV4V730_CAEEX|nr:hypothetical protein CEXT_166441 [Caerostris extrusa]
MGARNQLLYAIGGTTCGQETNYGMQLAPHVGKKPTMVCNWHHMWSRNQLWYATGTICGQETNYGMQLAPHVGKKPTMVYAQLAPHVGKKPTMVCNWHHMWARNQLWYMQLAAQRVNGTRNKLNIIDGSNCGKKLTMLIVQANLMNRETAV